MISTAKRSTLVLTAAVALALGLGGCNNKLKSENEQLREQANKLELEKTELATKITESEAARRDAEAKAMAKEQEAARVAAELAAARTQPMPMPPSYPNDYQGGGKRGGSNGGSDGRVIDVITVAGDVLFSAGSATLTSSGKKELDEVARTIKSRYSGNSVRVEGFTDSDPIRKSSWPSNKALSQARADAVEKYLASKGISNGRISAVGMGSASPKSTKAASRRVEIKILG